MEPNKQNKCWAGNCKHRSQGPSCVICTHPKAIIYKDIKKTCKICGREPKELNKGCGACMGRGAYVYHTAYENCDCGGYEQYQNLN